MKKYTVISNAKFNFSNIWHWDKLYLMAYFPQIPLNVIVPLMGVYFPAFLIGLIEAGTSRDKLLGALGLYCLIFLIVEIVLSLLSARINSANGVFASRYQALVEKKNNSLDYEHIENPKLADLYQQASSAGESAEEIVLEINEFMMNVLGIFTYGSIIIALHPLMVVLLIASGLANYGILCSVRKYIHSNRDKWASLDRKNKYIYNLSLRYEYAKDIKLYDMLGWLTGLMTKQQKSRMDWHKRVWSRSFASAAFDVAMRFFRDGAAYVLLISLLVNGKLDIAGFVFLFGTITGFSDWLTSVFGQFNTIETLSDDISRIRNFLDIRNRFNYEAGAPLPQQAPYEIEFRKLCYCYPESESPAIDDMSFTINKGERLAIVGANGAGKTTLVKLMCGLYLPTSGQVILSGVDMRNYNINDYYTQFSTVFQDIYIAPVSIACFVAGSNDSINREKVRNSLALADLMPLIERLPDGIDTNLIKGVYDDGIDLSGGEKQKLLLARALYKNAPVVVLDEPTASLDPIAENEIYMKYAAMTAGKTSIFISHRLSATRFCDRIIFIENGKIAECGTHEELMKKDGSYAAMFAVQSRYYRDDPVEGGAADE